MTQLSRHNLKACCESMWEYKYEDIAYYLYHQEVNALHHHLTAACICTLLVTESPCPDQLAKNSATWLQPSPSGAVKAGQAGDDVNPQAVRLQRWETVKQQQYSL